MRDDIYTFVLKAALLASLEFCPNYPKCTNYRKPVNVYDKRFDVARVPQGITVSIKCFGVELIMIYIFYKCSLLCRNFRLNITI